MLSGSTVEVKEMLARFTTEVLTSCALGINSNSLKEPDSEFVRRIRTIFNFTVQKRLAVLMAFFAPHLNTIFRLNFIDDKTNNYLRQNIWNTVQYR
jgi:cytochrome P450 family 6